MSESIHRFKMWTYENRKMILLILGIYSLFLVSLGMVQFPYIDDTARQIYGDTNFWRHFSRLASELLSWVFQGSRHLTDQGLTNFLISSLVLSLCSILTLRYFVQNGKVTFVMAMVSTIIGLNPWFLECLSFRFDSPFMCFSLLFAIIPYLFWKNKWYTFYALSSVSVLLLCNSYQSSSGTFIVYALALFSYGILTGSKFVEEMLRLVTAASGFTTGMIIYLLETKLNPEIANRGNLVEIAKIRDLPKTLVNNVLHYFYVLYSDSSKIWVITFLVLIFLCFVTLSIFSKQNILSSTIISVFYLSVGAVFSYGVLLVFRDPLISILGRYGGYNFPIYISVTCIMCLSILERVRPIYVLTNFAVVLFVYFQLAFCFGYPSMLSVQKTSFEFQSSILANDLKNIVTDSRRTINANKFFKSSNVLVNSERNFPILRKLVPQNEKLYWPNQFWFNNISGMNIQLNPASFDFSTLDTQSGNIQKVVDNYYYTIYVDANQIYLYMK